MPDGQFDIFIWGGSETVAGGRDFLREQDAELNRAMNDFMQCCKEEKAAFEQSVNAMGNQCYNSAQLADSAEKIAWKADERLNRADSCLGTMREYVGPAERWVEGAEMTIRSAEAEISSCEIHISGLDQDIERESSTIEAHQIWIKSSQENINRYREWMENDTTESGRQTNIGRIKAEQYSIEREQSHINDSKRKISSCNDEKSRVQDRLAAAQKKKSAAEIALAAARTHLQLCRQKVAEAEKLKRQAEVLKRKTADNKTAAEKARDADSDKLWKLKAAAKESVRVLGGLSDNSLSVQRKESDNLVDNASIMEKLAELMYDYETFSLDGGKS